MRPQELLLAVPRVAVLTAVVGHVLEQVLVQLGGRREAAEAVGHEQPSPLPVHLVVVLPGLVAKLAEELVAHRTLLETPLDHIVAKYSLPPPAEVAVVHEPQDKFEECQRLLVLRVGRFRQERGPDGLPLHAPHV
uniref:Putative secreted protein n=1 Tax=Ixodes ricinus TaxID=34613 RepID=A0A6B0USL1_IXORI